MNTIQQNGAMQISQGILSGQELVKTGYTLTNYYNWTFDFFKQSELIRQGKHPRDYQILKLNGTSDKKRYLIPALFGGLAVKHLNMEQLIIGDFKQDFLRILQESDPALKNYTYEECVSLLAGADLSSSGSLMEKCVCDWVKVSDRLNQKYTHLHFSDALDLWKQGIDGGLEVFQHAIDEKWYVCTGTGWEKHLADRNPGSEGIGIRNDVVQMYMKSEVHEGTLGLMWGRWYLYEEM